MLIFVDAEILHGYTECRCPGRCKHCKVHSKRGEGGNKDIHNVLDSGITRDKGHPNKRDTQTKP